MTYREILPKDDAPLAAIIRDNLKKHGLDIPGTAYFDSNLDHLSEFYLAEPAKRVYFVLTDEKDQVAGGAGVAEFAPIPGCAELQKLYLAEYLQGGGLGYEMIGLVEERARRLGYRQIYLETHTNLRAALHIYEKMGYTRIPKPDFVVHSTMNRFYSKSL